MKSKKNTFFTFCILLLYGGAVLGFALSLLWEYHKGPERARERFTELERETIQNLQVNDLTSEAFSNAFLRSIGNVSDIAGIQLIYNNEALISYPPPEILQVRGASYAKSSLIQTTRRDLYARDGKAVTLQAAIYLLKPSSIYEKGRIAFLAILLTTVVSICYLIYLYTSYSKPAQVQDNDMTDEEFDDFFFKKETDFSQENAADDTNEAVEEAPPLEPMNIKPFVQETQAPLQRETVAPPPPPAPESAGEPKSVKEPEDASYADTGNADHFEAQADDDFEEDERILQSTITQEEFQALTRDFLPEDEVQSPDAAVQTPPPAPESEEVAEEGIEDDAFEEPLAAPELEAAAPYDDDDFPDISEPERDAVLQDTLSSDTEEVPLSEHATADVSEEPETHKGLFSPQTGFGWEEYMIPRLDRELVHAASSEQDLALMYIKITSLEWNTEAGRDISELISQTVKFNDLVFEYKTDGAGCTALFQNTDINEALTIAENMHTDIISHLAKYSLYNRVCIGISSRSLRLISGSRLSNEAEQALSRALEDKDSPIIAFKVNPEKYRNYLASEAEKSAVTAAESERSQSSRDLSL